MVPLILLLLQRVRRPRARVGRYVAWTVVGFVGLVVALVLLTVAAWLIPLLVA